MKFNFAVFSIVAICSVFAAVSRAETVFQQRHPRRAAVNQVQKAHENEIKAGESNGSISPTEGAQLEQEQHGIKAEEHADVAANKASTGQAKLTRAEKMKLRQEQRAEQKEIKQGTTDAATPSAAPATN